ncbi:hypothetical protein T07_7715 [Trichinella nelsoni]|uniref:Uncharacterized protein n=1 Tax=Trichinella nelsoni TaxID=6336 RepID=A0A0V0RDC4_9BILA|nr:hypothetical protein T07_7715 [Trichinella nelsoni]
MVRTNEHFWHLIWVCIKIQQYRLLPDRVLTLRNFHYLPSRHNQPRTKHYCSEISKKLFPDYYDRRTTERTCRNVYIYSVFFIHIVLIIEKFSLKRNRNVSII